VCGATTSVAPFTISQPLVRNFRNGWW
jgi:hypothetical protein